MLAHCFPADYSFIIFGRLATSTSVTRPNRVHLRYGLVIHFRLLSTLHAALVTVAVPLALADPGPLHPLSDEGTALFGRSADEIVTATPDNRMVAYPYTKYSI